MQAFWDTLSKRSCCKELSDWYENVELKEGKVRQPNSKAKDDVERKLGRWMKTQVECLSEDMTFAEDAKGKKLRARVDKLKELAHSRWKDDGAKASGQSGA